MQEWREAINGDPADTVSLPNSATVREVQGRPVNQPPLLPQPGDVWAGIQPNPNAPPPPAASAALRPQPGNIWAGILPDQSAATPAPPAQAAVAEPKPTPAPQASRDRAADHPLVQLAATSSRKQAERAWREVKVHNHALVRGLHPLFERSEVNGHAVWRLRAEGFSGFAAANAFCSRLVAPRLDCWVVSGSPPS